MTNIEKIMLWGLMILIPIGLIWSSAHIANKAYNTQDKLVANMTCAELEMYITYYDTIEVARHLNSPIIFCEDYVDENKKNACQIMEKEKWEMMSLEGVKIVYDNKCKT